MSWDSKVVGPCSVTDLKHAERIEIIHCMLFGHSGRKLEINNGRVTRKLLEVQKLHLKITHSSKNTVNIRKYFRWTVSQIMAYEDL